jgi:hypothetical protein
LRGCGGKKRGGIGRDGAEGTRDFIGDATVPVSHSCG